MSQRDGATNCARSLFEQHPIMERQGLLHRGEVAPFHHEKRHTWKWLVYPCLFLLNEKLFDTFHRCIGSGTLVVGWGFTTQHSILSNYISSFSAVSSWITPGKLWEGSSSKIISSNFGLKTLPKLTLCFNHFSSQDFWHGRLKEDKQTVHQINDSEQLTLLQIIFWILHHFYCKIWKGLVTTTSCSMLGMPQHQILMWCSPYEILYCIFAQNIAIA